MRRTEINMLEFGDIDARQEILARDETKRQLFLNSFISPPSFRIEQLVSGSKFLICGPKGSGKTAFLRFLQDKLNKSGDSYSRFIVFRDDITMQDREKIVSLSQFRVYESGNGEGTRDTENLDCFSAWQLFIHREIAHVISRNHDLCAKTSDVLDYIKLLNSFFSQFKTSSFKAMLQRITRGRIKIDALGHGLEAEAEFIDRHGNVDVSEFVRYCDGVATNLDFNSLLNSPRINIFFDEVNINYVTGGDFRRNAILIRDLVSACGTMNLKFSESSIPIYIYTAIRSEVADAVESSVRELQKWIDDQGVFISWIIPGEKYESQPIIDLVRRRLAANEKRLNDLKDLPKEISLLDYFHPKVKDTPFEAYLLFETWGRPRDIVRLLNFAAKYVEHGGRFGTSSFAKAAREYSRSCWDEKKDELNSKYSQSMIDTIKRLLLRSQGSFSRSELEARISHQRSYDSRSNQFFEGRNLDVFLEDLFKVGILGNITRIRGGRSRPEYLYMGHMNFDSHGIMCIHRSLWQELSIEAAETAISTQIERTKRLRGKERR